MLLDWLKKVWKLPGCQYPASGEYYEDKYIVIFLKSNIAPKNPCLYTFFLVLYAPYHALHEDEELGTSTKVNINIKNHNKYIP